MNKIAAIGFSSARSGMEWLLALFLAGCLGLSIGMLNGLDVKYQVAAMLGGIGVGFLVLSPDRRLWCVVLWVLVMPLSIEKVFYVNAIYEKFVPQAIVINAGDLILLLLTVFLVVESLFTRERIWHWPNLATLFGLFLLWSLVSALMHAAFLETGYTSSSTWTLLQYVRVLWFIVLLHSAIRTRAELMVVVTAIGVIVLFEAMLVGLSYVTGQIYNFTKLTGGTPILSLQTYSTASGETIARGVGTLGQTNQQAAFHTFFTLPLIAFLVVRNQWLRFFVLVAIGASMVAVLLSFSRSAWLSFAVAILLAFAVAWRRGEIAPIAWLGGAIATIVLSVVLGALSGPLYERIADGDDGATDSRLRMIDLALDLFAQHPVIGVGPGEYPEAALLTYPPGFKENEWVPLGAKPIVPPVGRLEAVRLVQPNQETLTAPLPVHNKYLLTLAEQGVVGLALWLLIYLALVREAWRCSKSEDPFLRYLGLGGLATIVASLVYMQLDLFADEKSVQVLLFVPVMITAAARIARMTAVQAKSLTTT